MGLLFLKLKINTLRPLGTKLEKKDREKSTNKTIGGCDANKSNSNDLRMVASNDSNNHE